MNDPAIKTKIIEWSSRAITARARTDHDPRWYAAEVPNSRATEAAYTEAPIRARVPSARQTITVPVTSEMAKATS